MVLRTFKQYIPGEELGYLRQEKHFAILMLPIAWKYTFQYQNCFHWFFLRRKKPSLEIQDKYIGETNSKHLVINIPLFFQSY